MTENEKKKDSRRTVAAVTAVAVASAGVAAGTLFSSAEEIFDDEEAGLAPKPIMDVLQSGDGDGADDDDEIEEDDEDEGENDSSPSGFRGWIARAPGTVKAAVVLPLWALGQLLLALWTGVLSPVGGALLGTALTAGLALGGFAAAVKTVFPDVPLKKLINRKSITAALIAAAVLSVLDLVCPLFWDGYARLSAWVRTLGVLGVSGALTVRFTRRERARRKALPEETPVPEALPETMEEARARVRHMVDGI